MTDVSLETLNRRANLSAARAEAERIGADPDVLLDSVTFHGQVTALDPDAPGYHKQVRDLVTAAAGHREAAPKPAPAPDPDTAAGQPRQWTIEDVHAASSRGGSKAVTEAMDAGLLRDLGYAPRRNRR